MGTSVVSRKEHHATGLLTERNGVALRAAVAIDCSFAARCSFKRSASHLARSIPRGGIATIKPGHVLRNGRRNSEIVCDGQQSSASALQRELQGRMPTCEGLGVIYTDLQHLDPMAVRCETCEGRCFTDAVLGLTPLALSFNEHRQQRAPQNRYLRSRFHRPFRAS
jgi:hypothetical protein